MNKSRPNIIYVFSDQHRKDATGFNGNPDVLTPNLDDLAKESINFVNAVSGTPVCSPYRASLLTGLYPQTHGIFMNDLCLEKHGKTLADCFNEAGYATAYIGKWHLDGHGRKSFIPKERRKGFEFWRVLECTHDYNNSHYYGDENIINTWEKYDVFSQTECAQDYVKTRDKAKPFLLILSYGPPHDPYETAPERFKALYDSQTLSLRDNVVDKEDIALRECVKGYYAHISAIDSCVGNLIETLKEQGIYDETVFVYTSDHGDMLGSHGYRLKQKPWDESILVPFLMHYPAIQNSQNRQIAKPINVPDIMPTLLGLCDIEIPDEVEGFDFSKIIMTGEKADTGVALLSHLHPFGEWHTGAGGKEYRGVRTERYTYVKDKNGPWLLYDNMVDPMQQNNLCNDPAVSNIQTHLERILKDLLDARDDKFLYGYEYVDSWGYEVDETGTVPF